MKKLIPYIVVLCLIATAAPFADARVSPLKGTKPNELERLVSESGTTQVIVGFRTDGGWNAADNAIPEKATAQRTRVGQSLERLLRAHPNARRIDHAKFIPFVLLDVDRQALQALIEDENVTSIQGEVPIRRVLQQSTNIISSRAANLRGYRGLGTTVAVIDDGVQADHVFYNGRVGYEACFAPDCGTSGLEGPGTGAPCGPACIHGTHMAGIIAGNRPTHSLWGVAPETILASVRVFTQCGPSCQDPNHVYADPTGWGIVKALEWVYDHRFWNFAAVNLSLTFGYPKFTQASCYDAVPAIDSAITTLWMTGIAVVAGAGNDGVGTFYAPACCRQAYAVGATYDNDTFAAQYSNSPSNLAFLAPGGNGLANQSIYSSYPGSTWGESYGTSESTAHVAGAFAVLRSATGFQTPLTSLYNALRNTGLPVLVTPGAPNVPRINVDAAVRVFRP